jgi:hypothetical protein
VLRLVSGPAAAVAAFASARTGSNGGISGPLTPLPMSRAALSGRSSTSAALPRHRSCPGCASHPGRLAGAPGAARRIACRRSAAPGASGPLRGTARGSGTRCVRFVPGLSAVLAGEVRQDSQRPGPEHRGREQWRAPSPGLAEPGRLAVGPSCPGRLLAGSVSARAAGDGGRRPPPATPGEPPTAGGTSGPLMPLLMSRAAHGPTTKPGSVSWVMRSARADPEEHELS